MELPITENNQNPPLPSSASMEDVPLSNDEPDTQATGSIDKIPSKTNSLKRFFKMNLNKKSSTHNDIDNVQADNADTTANDADTEDTNEEVPVKSENLENHVEKRSSSGLRRSRSHRFSFRSHSNANTDSGNDEPTSSSSVSSPSKHSLRVSLSTYFNSVFKRKNNSPAKSSAPMNKDEEFDQKEGDDELSKELKRELEQKITEDDNNMNIESHTAEIIDELETMTVTEAPNAGMPMGVKSAYN